jgi:hypothetical protein
MTFETSCLAVLAVGLVGAALGYVAYLAEHHASKAQSKTRDTTVAHSRDAGGDHLRTFGITDNVFPMKPLDKD